jgi:hypothetical protein
MGKEGPGESYIIADPLFADYQKGSEPSDFSIIAKSPARNKGLDLGYKKDFENHPIPQEGAPDIGAFECKPY